MQASITTLSLAGALLILSVGAGLAEAEAGGSPPAPAVIKPQLPFVLPELPDDATPPTAPGPAGAFSAPHPGPATAGVTPQVPHPRPQVAVVEEDIRDIQGPFSVPANTIWGWGLLIILVVLLAGLVAGWFTFRRRPAAQARQAYEIAFEHLERARLLMQPQQAREFSIQVSGAVRTYLDQRFQVGAIHCTTEEFLADLVATPHNPLQTYTGPLRDFLGHCDLAKFAGFALSVPQMEAMHRSAWKLVDETRPRPENNQTQEAAKRDRPSAVADAVPSFAAGGA